MERDLKRLIIRSESIADIPDIISVNDLAFDQDSESILISRLRQLENFRPELSIVAVFDNKVIGHILFYPVYLIEHPSLKLLSLAPLAVHPSFQKQGIGGQLILHGISEGKKRGFEAVVVLGHPLYYPKFGFKKASPYGIRAPWDGIPEEAFMLLEIKNGCLEGVAGKVVYPPEFDAAL
jgi:putative acetyltransferase